jgi:Fe2+ transport system protein B
MRQIEIMLITIIFQNLLMVTAMLLGSLTFLMSLFLLFQFRWASGGPILWALKSFSGALAPYLALTGMLCAIVGVFTASMVALLTG